MEPKRILVRLTCSKLGDFLMATPTLAGLRDRYPNASITALNCLKRISMAFSPADAADPSTSPAAVAATNSRRSITLPCGRR